ncbi:hypothetical protein EVA_12861 [gut metagenome]|uniref:Uncharacterized protein n=1 Tax=gut metagenome TaxID=749906 RepID=J9FWZ5_9ZZZZ
MTLARADKSPSWRESPSPVHPESSVRPAESWLLRRAFGVHRQTPWPPRGFLSQPSGEAHCHLREYVRGRSFPSSVRPARVQWQSPQAARADADEFQGYRPPDAPSVEILP